MTADTNRPSEVRAETLDRLNRGELEASTLAECLAVDFEALMRVQFPLLDLRARLLPLGKAPEIVARMEAAGSLLRESLAAGDLYRLCAHPSDTVRGWAAYALGADPAADLGQSLDRVRPFADDHHFGVREWAWLAVRPKIAIAPVEAIALLSVWAGDASYRVRRFAVESTRPRGVWCSHIALLKQEPWLALPLLCQVAADPERYVQDSCGNWLNDAAKTQPDWVKSLCTEWTETRPSPAASRIAKRATRSLR